MDVSKIVKYLKFSNNNQKLNELGLKKEVEKINIPYKNFEEMLSEKGIISSKLKKLNKDFSKDELELIVSEFSKNYSKDNDEKSDVDEILNETNFLSDEIEIKEENKEENKEDDLNDFGLNIDFSELGVENDEEKNESKIEEDDLFKFDPNDLEFSKEEKIEADETESKEEFFEENEFSEKEENSEEENLQDNIEDSIKSEQDDYNPNDLFNENNFSDENEENIVVEENTDFLVPVNSEENFEIENDEELDKIGNENVEKISPVIIPKEEFDNSFDYEDENDNFLEDKTLNNNEKLSDEIKTLESYTNFEKDDNKNSFEIPNSMLEEVSEDEFSEFENNNDNLGQNNSEKKKIELSPTIIAVITFVIGSGIGYLIAPFILK